MVTRFAERALGLVDSESPLSSSDIVEAGESAYDPDGDRGLPLELASQSVTIRVNLGVSCVHSRSSFTLCLLCVRGGEALPVVTITEDLRGRVGFCHSTATEETQALSFLTSPSLLPLSVFDKTLSVSPLHW